MGDGLIGKFKTLIGIEDAEYEEEEMEEEVQTQQPMAVGEQRRASARPAASTSSTSFSVSSSSFDRGNTFVQPKIDRKENKVVSMQSTSTPTGTQKKQFKLVVTEPKSFDECPALVNSLKNRKPIILNLEKMDNESARKIFDFLSGAIYALDGRIQQVSDNIFLFAPESVDVMSDIEAENAKKSLGLESPWRR